MWERQVYILESYHREPASCSTSLLAWFFTVLLVLSNICKNMQGAKTTGLPAMLMTLGNGAPAQVCVHSSALSTSLQKIKGTTLGCYYKISTLCNPPTWNIPWFHLYHLTDVYLKMPQNIWALSLIPLSHVTRVRFVSVNAFGIAFPEKPI